ncbi:unnamed protein product [Lota lota]
MLPPSLLLTSSPLSFLSSFVVVIYFCSSPFSPPILFSSSPAPPLPSSPSPPVPPLPLPLSLLLSLSPCPSSFPPVPLLLSLLLSLSSCPSSCPSPAVPIPPPLLLFLTSQEQEPIMVQGFVCKVLPW